MEQLRGKVAIVTGASSGIGAATAKVLAEAGLIVAGLARRKEKIEELSKVTKGKLYAIKADVSKEEDILRAFEWIGDNLGPVHVLVNNAGVSYSEDVSVGETQKWRALLDTNVLAVAIASREAIRIMRANQIDGQIVNVNSILGHQVHSIKTSIYPSTKFAVTALTETLRLELIRSGSKIRVTSLSPGLVATEIFDVFGISKETLQKHLGIEIALTSEDVAEAVKYVLSTPPHVQITELTIQPVEVSA